MPRYVIQHISHIWEGLRTSAHAAEANFTQDVFRGGVPHHGTPRSFRVIFDHDANFGGGFRERRAIFEARSL